MADQYEYECALSGVTEEGGFSYADDGMSDCPPGWVQVTMKRRLINPKYVAIQRTKESMIALAVQQIPGNVSQAVAQAQRAMLTLQVEANFHGLESVTPPFLTYEERVYIAPPESNPDLLEAFNEVREGIGLDRLDGTMFSSDDEDSDENDSDDDSESTQGEEDIEELDAES